MNQSLLIHHPYQSQQCIALIIVDQKLVKMEEFKCPICKKQYCQANPPRLLTMCGHTFCHQCLKTMFKRKDNRFQVRCPEDRISMNVDLATPSYFPKNMAILQAIIKARKLKDQNAEDKNEFLVSSSDQEDSLSSDRRMSMDIREYFMDSRRTNLEQGLCLLHQKPLDIICTDQKKYICAECALFGLHKGHRFTTIKELNIKRSEWLQDVLGVIEEQKNVQQKFISGQYKRQISLLLQNKKQKMLSQTTEFYTQIRTILQQNQKKLRLQITERIELMEQQLVSNLAIDSVSDSKFSQWSKNVEDKIASLQSEDIVNCLGLFYDPSSDLVTKGKLILSDMNKHIIQFWSNIQKLIQYPKIQCSQQLNTTLQKIISLQISNPKINDCGRFEDHDRLTQITSIPLPNDISLLDNFQFKEDVCDQIITKKTENEVETLPVQMNCLSSRVSNVPEQNKPYLSFCKSLKRVRSGNLSVYQSGINLYEAKFQSPKNIKKSQNSQKYQIRRTNLLSPTSGKFNKFKRNIMRLKQPQKMQKIISLMEKDALETADLTGLQMGDQIAKQICLKVGQSKKIKMLRLVKNQLTDECSRQVAFTLTKISFLNLAQNNFSEVFLDELIDLRKKVEIKGKTVQMGQNRINARKHKEKIDELKCLGIIITL